MSYDSSLEVLPSREYLAQIGSEVMQIAESGLRDATREQVLTGLGHLALSLAHRPLRRWQGDLESLVPLCVGQGALEARTTLEIALDCGLLSEGSDAQLYPTTPHHFTWLAARATALNDDARGLMDERMRGSLWDVFAMAPSFVVDETMAEGLVALMAQRHGPWEDQLQLSALLAAQALAWGAPAEDALRAELLEKAIDWTMPTATPQYFEGGAAVLAAEVRGGPFAAEVLEGTQGRLGDLLEMMAADSELREHPLVLASLETHLTTLLAACEDETDIEAVFSQAPGQQAHIARAIGQVHAPGAYRDECVLYAVSRAVQAGQYEAIVHLGTLSAPHEGAVSLLGTSLQMLHDEPNDPSAQRASRAACEALANWKTVPESIGFLLARNILAPVEPELRIACAGALSMHPKMLESAAPTLLETLEANFSREEPVIRSGIVGAALHLGTRDPTASALAIGLVADGVPAALLGPALDEALRSAPSLAKGLEAIWTQVEADEALTVASLLALGEVAEGEALRLGAGPYARRPPLSAENRELIEGCLEALALDLSAPLRAGEAAVSLGWLRRGDKGFAEALLGARSAVKGESEMVLFDLALGACGVASQAIIERLARDAADGNSTVSMGAAGALRILLEDVADADPLEPFLHRLEARAQGVGEEREALLGLLHFLATRPLGER